MPPLRSGNQRPRTTPAARRWDPDSGAGAASTRGRPRGESSNGPHGLRARRSRSNNKVGGVLGPSYLARGREGRALTPVRGGSPQA
ncbi:hypothetical protein C8Q77DRAFT_1122897 [Trametes polyzona]|nr:hypothetical protein C8Q77DRAFT_1122897 [Trametes polyzona]